MKKILLYMLACFLVLSALASCTEEKPTGTETQPTTSQPSVSVTIPSLQLPEKVGAPVAQREKTGPLIDYDPNRELYILTGTHDYTYYLGGPGGDHWYSFYIFSKNPLDVNGISLDIPVEHPYEVYVKEVELEGARLEGEGTNNYQNTEFPYELYQCYQGKDFRKLTELRWELSYRNAVWNYANDWLENEKLENPELEEVYQEWVDNLLKEYRTAVDAWQSYRDAELEGYYALTKEDLPQFYVYFVSAFFSPINIEHIPDETFTEITVTVGKQIYRQQIGQITLKSGHTEAYDQRDWVLDGYNIDDGILGYGNYPLPYNDGVNYIVNYFSIEKVDRYKSLTKLVLDNPNQKLEAVWITLIPQGGTASYYKWDMTEPFELYPGDQVYIDIVYSDDYMDSHYLGYRTKVYGYLEYESDGKTWYKVSECGVENTMNLYLLYAIIFDGLDVESYYWDYYYPSKEGWRLDPDISPFESLPFMKG